MCLILFAYRNHPRYNLILAANRDEFYERATARLNFWNSDPDILAGRDLRYGGTWMGLTRSGKFAAVTNFRDKGEFREHPLSRGLMVRDFLAGSRSPGQFIEDIVQREGQYNGFNLLAADHTDMVYYSNRSHRLQVLEPGIYGLSNHLLETPWPKLVRSKEKFSNLVNSSTEFNPEIFFEILSDTVKAPDDQLPDTGFGIEWERILSSPFISSPEYGTRASTVILAGKDGNIRVMERSYRYQGDPGKTSDISFSISSPHYLDK